MERTNNPQDAAFIKQDDGYTFGGYFAEVKGQVPEVRFRYRPLVP